MITHNYKLLLEQAKGLLDGESDYLANAANLSALLFTNMQQVSWLGFYFLRNDHLRLGPFQGPPACTRIALGAGVCGSAFIQQKTLLVDDVHQFDGHIACDVNSKSEIVVPFKTANLSGVLDVDSPVISRFTISEQALFEAAVQVYLDSLPA